MDIAWVICGLAIVMGLVLVLPFSVKKVEEELEIFLFIMGVLAVSISGLWSLHLVKEALIEPIKITFAVLLAGFVFRYVRPKIGAFVQGTVKRFGYGFLFFVVVFGLGLLSSVITAIIAALVLAEIVTALKLSRKSEVRLVIIACFAIGLGAVLTPLGEPLATIAVAKLKGPPHNANFFFLLKMLGIWVIPGVFVLGIFAAFMCRPDEVSENKSLKEDKIETNGDVIIRSLRVYLFVMALVFLGTGFKPVVEKYLVQISGKTFYWINTVSAILDNATLTAAEITPTMPDATIKMLLLGLLISGGMLIPGNIPNIICASKLSIKSREWAMFGVPVGMVLMIAFFVILLLAGN